MAVKGAKALEVWARRVTDGYPNVKIRDMSSSWKNGLAFCAIIHRFRPELIDFHSMDPQQIERNCCEIFRVAEEELGIPSLLDPVDMAECGTPDRLSILTYLSEFYHKFKAEKSPSNSPVTPKKDELSSSNSLNKTCPELKRKDSCDSGVSVSPLGSVCNSPPPSVKSKNSSLPATPLVTSTPKSEDKKKLQHQSEQSASKSNPDSAVSSLILQSATLTPSTPPQSRAHDSAGDTGLENLLRQRLRISLDTTPKSSYKGYHETESQNQRSNLLQSMISPSSVSSSSVSPDIEPVSTGNRTFTESVRLNNTKSEPIVPVTKSSRRHTLDTVDTIGNIVKGRVSQLSQSFANSCGPQHQSSQSKFVSKTTISLTENNPIKYSSNNSVTCDIKSNNNSLSSPKSWKEFHKSTEAFSSLQQQPCKSVSMNHSPLQVKINSPRCVETAAGSSGRIVITPSSSSSSSDSHSTGSSTGCNDGAEADLNSNLKNLNDNSFKSRMMKFEQMINPGASKVSNISKPATIKRVNLSCNQEDQLYNPTQEASKHERRKTISFPASFALSSMIDTQDSRLTF